MVHLMHSNMLVLYDIPPRRKEMQIFRQEEKAGAEDEGGNYRKAFAIEHLQHESAEHSPKYFGDIVDHSKRFYFPRK